MKILVHLFLLAALGALLSGCYMHTVIGDGLGTPSPDGRFRLAISSNGAPRKAYVDSTKKRVYVWMITNENNQPETKLGEYRFESACLGWRTRWLSPQEVTVDFFDFGDKITSYDAKEAGIPSNHVATLSFVLDVATGKWIEKK